LALILLVPLAVMPEAREAFRLPKLLLAEWLGLASLVGLALRAGGARGAAQATAVATPLWRLPAVQAALPLFVVAALGAAFSPHTAYVRNALIDLGIASLCLVGWSVALRREEGDRLLTANLLPAWILTIVAVLQALRIFQPFAFAEANLGDRMEVTALAGNPGDLGAFLVLPCLVAQLAFWRASRASADPMDGRRRGLWLASALATAAGVALSQTLVALVALAAASVVLWWHLSPRHSTVVRLIAGLLIAGGLAGLLVTPLRERLAGKLDQLEQGDLNAVLSGRLDGWRAAVWMARQHPLTGVGLGGYGSEFAPAKLALLDQGVRFYDGHVRFSFVNAHNEPLEVAAELGLPGLLAALWAACIAIRATTKLARGDRPRGALAWAGLASLLLLGLGQFPFRVAMVAYPNLLLLAWIFSASSATSVEGTSR
jgi:O-antigen ligase